MGFASGKKYIKFDACPDSIRGHLSIRRTVCLRTKRCPSPVRIIFVGAFVLRGTAVVLDGPRSGGMVRAEIYLRMLKCRITILACNKFKRQRETQLHDLNCTQSVARRYD
jgi:hypothetical protein